MKLLTMMSSLPFLFVAFISTNTLLPGVGTISVVDAAASSSDKYCEDGIFNTRWCCPSWCDKCGGKGCAGISGTQNKECCTGNFVNSCDDHQAPCIVNLDQQSTGICVIAPDTYDTGWITHSGLRGNYQLAGNINGHPYWRYDDGENHITYVYSSEDDGGEIADEYGEYHIGYDLGNSQYAISSAVIPYGLPYSAYPYGYSWYYDIAMLPGSCEEYLH